jgi:hypothetical protein
MIDSTMLIEKKIAKARYIILSYCIHQWGHQGIILDFPVEILPTFKSRREVEHGTKLSAACGNMKGSLTTIILGQSVRCEFFAESLDGFHLSEVASIMQQPRTLSTVNRVFYIDLLHVKHHYSR